MNDDAGRERDTIAVYDAQAERYAELAGGSDVEDPWFAAFVAAVGAGGRVLDLGCGPGASAAAMARAGLLVEAVDASISMVELARRGPGVDVRQATFAELDAVDRYAGVWASFSLLHAPKREFPPHLEAVHRALVPDGVFFVALKVGEGEQVDRLGRFYGYYLDDELDALLADTGFDELDRWSGRGRGLDGTESDWTARLARARSGAPPSRIDHRRAG